MLTLSQEDIRSLALQIAPVLAKELAAQEVPQTGTITSTQAMKLLGYKDREAFWAAVKRLRIPYERIGTRKAIFEASDVHRAKEARQIIKRRVAAPVLRNPEGEAA
ncbi:MAG: hypothetical protein KDK74_15470 [Cephaloticoccus sp.]|nr:hypothetical protein [Cephaloticoccus sp.]